MKGKQVRVPHKKTKGNNTSRPLYLLYMEVMGSMWIDSKDGKKKIHSSNSSIFSQD